MADGERPPLRLIRGTGGPAVMGTVQVTVVPAEKAPVADAVVAEEDTWQVLAAGPEASLVSEHPVRLFTELLDAEPLVPGTVLVREGPPLTLVAVIHDFEAEPCCRSEWITVALAGIVRICRERRLKSLLLPLPGTAHGRMPPAAAVRLVAGILRTIPACGLATVYIAVPTEGMEEARRLLAAEAAQAPGE